MTATASHIIVTCWIIFLIVWVVNASQTKRTVERQSRASTLVYRIPAGFGWWLLLASKWPPSLKLLNWQILPRSAILQIAGAAICICGLLFTLWARYTLAGNWSSDVTFKQDHELVRRGPSGIVRHPIYTGLLLMWLGTAIYIGQLRGVISLVLVAIAFWIKLRREERLMLQHFPDAYPNYRRK